MADFHFAPVNVSRGRKFKGFGYRLWNETRHVAWNVSYDCATIWDPKAKHLVYANLDFCEDVEQSEEEINAARQAYIDTTIESTIAWAKSKKPDGDWHGFARFILLRHHPEMVADINKALPDNRDVVKEIDRTLTWAMNLRTRQGFIYKKWCEGGKAYPPSVVVRKAYNALQHRGITSLPGFKEAWNMLLTMKNLPQKAVILVDGDEVDPTEGCEDVANKK